jgi:hypothetical protein
MTLRRHWRSTTFEPVEVVRQGRSQLDDPTPVGSAEQIELDLRPGRKVLIPWQDNNPARVNWALELLHQIGDIDIGLTLHDVG